MYIIWLIYNDYDYDYDISTFSPQSAEKHSQAWHCTLGETIKALWNSFYILAVYFTPGPRIVLVIVSFQFFSYLKLLLFMSFWTCSSFAVLIHHLLTKVLVDTLLDDPNQRSSGGVTMLMNAANTGPAEVYQPSTSGNSGKWSVLTIGSKGKDHFGGTQFSFPWLEAGRVTFTCFNHFTPS